MPDEDPYQPFCDPDNLATVVRKTDCEVHRGVAADDYSTDDWFHDPDLSAVSGVPPKYWKNDSDCIVEMTAAEKAAVDAPTFLFKAPSKVVSESISVTQDTTWQDLGGSATTITAFVSDITKAWGRFVAQVKVSGTGAKLQIIRDSDDAVCMAASYEHGDTGGEWEYAQFWANQNQPTGIDTFILQGKLDGATSFEIRFGTLSLMEKVS